MTTAELPKTGHDAALRRVVRAIRAEADPTTVTQQFCGSVFADEPELRVLAAGKAGVTMMRAASAVLEGRIKQGLVIAPEAQCASHGFGSRIRIMASDHPLPTARSIASAEALLGFVSEGDGPLVVLLSGGGSAMTVLPVAGVTLGNLREVADGLMRAGATIAELNCVRKHLDLAKGGRVGIATHGRPVRVGVISDVLGDRLDVISSGPLVGDESSFSDAAAVLDRYAIRIASVDAVLAEGVAGRIEETPEPDDPRLASITHTILSSNTVVALAAGDALRELGFDPDVSTSKEGAASGWGERVAATLRRGPGAIVLGGESVVSGVPEGAVGGPVQEAVLTAGHALRGCGGWMIVGIATDGVDGPTDAAGAVLTPGLLPETDACESALQAHSSYPVLQRAGALITTGPSGTNLNDVLVGIRWAEDPAIG